MRRPPSRPPVPDARSPHLGPAGPLCGHGRTVRRSVFGPGPKGGEGRPKCRGALRSSGRQHHRAAVRGVAEAIGSTAPRSGKGNATAATAVVDDDDPSAPLLLWEGVPPKAWMWQKTTEPQRKGQIRAVVTEGAFEAPVLKVRMARDRFFEEVGEEEEVVVDANANANANANDGIGNEGDEGSHNEEEGTYKCPSTDPAFHSALPPTWRNPHAAAPGTKPWSTSDLASIPHLPEFALSWPGADPTVPPCAQTTGTTRAGMARWNAWVRTRSGLKEYGRRRNDMRQPHAPSRMSAYLNLGIVSIFRLVHEVQAAQAQKVAGADKFADEIVKWREMAYAFCVSRTDYCGGGAVPPWAQRWLEQQQEEESNKDGGGRWEAGGGVVETTVTPPPPQFGWNSLALGRTGHAKWDAMQRYLVSTGELHNHVRMTWGKTVVGWASRLPREEGRSVTASVLQTLCYLNDRYALDGLSPPSYAGLLWCLGWCDKPGKGGGPSSKPASHYRYAPEDFEFAERALLAGPGGNNSSAGRSSGSQGNGSAASRSKKHSASQSSILDMMTKQQPKAKKQRTGDQGDEKESSTVKESIRSASKPSPGVNDTKKKGSIASFFSPKSK